MSGTVKVANYLRDKEPNLTIALIGSHIQALPIQTIQKELCFDFGFANEGVYALRNVLSLETINECNLLTVKGLVVRDGNKIVITKPEWFLMKEWTLICRVMPGIYYHSKKTSRFYRSPMWHVEYNEAKRSPTQQPDLGCDLDAFLYDKHDKSHQEEVGDNKYSQMRHWSTNLSQ